MIDNKTADRLIGAVAGGDMTALETLYSGLAQSVYAFARSIVRDDAAAQDIMQDTFVRVYNSAGGFKACGMGVAWIMRIARNLSLNAVQRYDRAEPEEAMEEAAAADSTEETAESRIMIERAMDSLTDAEREVVTLHAVSGLRLEKIALMLDIPLGTVKWRNAQAMKKIRAAMSGEEDVL